MLNRLGVESLDEVEPIKGRTAIFLVMTSYLLGGVLMVILPEHPAQDVL